MGLMLGEFVDDYTVKVVDVFAMPQSGTGVSVEAVDPVFQTKMLDMLKQVGRCVLFLFVCFVSVSGKIKSDSLSDCIRRHELHI
jgi:26S proteasome regulatory subunit N11